MALSKNPSYLRVLSIVLCLTLINGGTWETNQQIHRIRTRTKGLVKPAVANRWRCFPRMLLLRKYTFV
jgi:hypothetical protein